MLDLELQNTYTAILEAELVPATGCTEPIAIAYAAAKLRDMLGGYPEKILAEVSGNILKNVKSVVVPNTGGMKGIKAAISAGIVAGQAELELQVIGSVSPDRYDTIKTYCEETPIEVSCFDTPHPLDIRLTGWIGEHRATIRITGGHSNIVYMEKDSETLLEKNLEELSAEVASQKAPLTLRGILDYAAEVDLSLVSHLLERQIAYNTAIAEEGLKNNWGANIGSTLLQDSEHHIKTVAKAWAAAGSDARMSGCEMPVIIVSGSGNQGMTASLPVIRYAEHLGSSHEQLLRALLVSNLVSIYQKIGIGRLSAYCGAVCAGIGAGSGIAYLHGAGYDAIAHTIMNASAIRSGTICDGAKPSCAAKIAASVDAGILGYQMYLGGNNFDSGDGIIGVDVESTVANVGVLASQGMKETDRTILNIMTATS